jgi:hypothetical protein
MLERFLEALSCIDQCFIADDLLERLPAASQVGKTKVGGIDLNRQRMRQVVAEALIALSASRHGFRASELAARVRALGKQTQSQYGPRRVAYDLKKLRGKQIVRRIGPDTPLRADPDRPQSDDRAASPYKAIKPLLAAAQELGPTRGPQNPRAIDAHYDAIRVAMQGVFNELGMAA